MNYVKIYNKLKNEENELEYFFSLNPQAPRGSGKTLTCHYLIIGKYERLKKIKRILYKIELKGFVGK